MTGPEKWKYKNLVFDFDGVIVETNEIRFEGFRKLFTEYPSAKVQELVSYARANGGISRYAKIRYFFEKVLGTDISEVSVNKLALQYSEIVKGQVVSAEAVSGSLEFFETNYGKYNFAIISGSDEKELREVCKKRKIDQFFLEILGSPTNKANNFEKLFKSTGWEKNETLFIGDSVNDYEAARVFGVYFVGRKSGLESWRAFKVPVINDIMELQRLLAVKL